MKESAEKHLAVAIECYQHQRFAEAEAICRELTAIPLPASRSCFLLGLVLGKTKRWPEASHWLERAAELDPAAPEVWSELGRASNALGDLARAAACFRRFIELKPANADGYFCLGNSYQRMGRHEEAVSEYAKSVELNACDAAAWNNLGMALSELNRLTEALSAYDRALAMGTEYALARRNRAIALLKAGRWEEGWPDYEWRRSILVPSPYPQPKWNGEAMPGKTLFVQAEQGLGDSIQFVRFVKLARARVGRVILECQKPLKRLFEQCGCADMVTAVGEQPPPFDAHVALASLPGIFHATPETIIGKPYLSVRPREVFFKNPGSQIKVGLVWAGNAGYGRDAERSIQFEQLLPILKIKNVAFFSFQTPLPARDEAGLKNHPEIANLENRLNDFLDTAALVAGMDLMISVDTAVAHLAGALGKPVWLLLPFASDWRWLLERSDTVWYQTMRLFRQRNKGDWHSTIWLVKNELEKLSAV